METMALKKAKILVNKGSIKEQIDVMFNPTEYDYNLSNKYSWKVVPGLSMPIGQFVSGETSTMSMEFFFDTYEQGTDVRIHTKKISELLNVDKDLHAPPVCRFVWGSIDFKGVVVSVKQKFTMFLDSGTPVRAKLNVTFNSWQTKTEQLKGIPRQSADRTKQKMLKQGEQLWLMASAEYENPGLWREIAHANGIDNPLKLEPGRRITVPRLE
jgi:hypothetical protein